MGRREQEKLPFYTFAWHSPHEGRYWKKLLARARRRAWKDPHCRGLVGLERTVNWKNT